MGGIGRLGMFIMKAFIVCSLIEGLFVTLYFWGMKNKNIRNQTVQDTLYVIMILFNLFYIPFFLWAMGGFIF